MFRAERIYSQSNPKTGMIEWFFSAREGNFGPFDSKEIATKELQAFINLCIKNGDDGGRGGGGKSKKLSLEPVHDFVFKRRE
ncbi:DUF6316 family protein [Methylomicrobium sp. RS1]|uniref:DUF6316 family protein n=1 Tax=Candidatus Methylomicrobium oryzae TaxID=2802053 RepID=UPI001922926C|nr:hypothetical protein [Methylomicrobium sp. RS1]